MGWGGGGKRNDQKSLLEEAPSHSAFFIDTDSRRDKRPYFETNSMLLVAKAVTVGTGLVGNGPQPRSPNVAVGVRMGLLPEGVQSGFPAPLTLDGSTCLSVPPQYNFSDAGQRSNIVII